MDTWQEERTFSRLLSEEKSHGRSALASAPRHVIVPQVCCVAGEKWPSFLFLAYSLCPVEVPPRHARSAKGVENIKFGIRWGETSG